MNYSAMIRELRKELARVNRAIERIEARPPQPRDGRGRKNMPFEERADVSKRMKSYWAKRRQLKGQ